MARTARAFAELMHRLGYERYGAQGGDIGAGIIGMLASIAGEHVAAVHTNSDPLAVIGALDFLRRKCGAGPRPLRSRPGGRGANAGDQRGGIRLPQLQSNRPQTMAYSLTDSPVGQLAWIVENFKEWTDPGPRCPKTPSTATSCLPTSRSTGSPARRFRGRLPVRVRTFEGMGCAGDVPQGWALFAAQPFVRAMMDPGHEIEHWSEFDRGGHFPAMEVPDLLVGDVRKFFRRFR